MEARAVGKIIKKHVFTLFNFVNIVLAIMVLMVGSYKNVLFIFVAIFNTIIGVSNELRALSIINRLRLVAERPPTVLRDGQPRPVSRTEVEVGDIMVLSLGEQILFDAKVKTGVIEVNESLVTGEQATIAKHPGDQLISGSFVTSGACQAVVEHVGADNFVSRLESDARSIKTTDSHLFRLMGKIIKYISYALIPIGALLLWSRFRIEADATTAVTSTVAALISMIPEGLILLTSSVLAIAAIRLSRAKVLVQNLYSIETLARVDTICLDKTGTLTTGNLKVKDIIPADGQSENALKNALELILGYLPADNATSQAMHAKFVLGAKKQPTAKNVEIIPFSSERKYSGIRTGGTAYLIGAADFLTKDPNIIKTAKSLAGDYRILTVIKRHGADTLLGFVRLEDEIRPTAPKIIQYFYDNDIAIKIISGDDLVAVQSIASKVGVKDLRGIDLSAVKSKNYTELVQKYSIFTRAKPTEKKKLIAALKKQGATVAMTGDGVNDILAMKEADVSLSIGAGSDAARRASQIVLMSSGFEAVPSIIDEGRQSINNLERSTSLFLSKTVYASILAVLFTILPLSYPYTPIEMSLLNFACIGFPGLVLALEHNTSRIKNQFIYNIKHYSVPTGITIVIAMLILAICARIFAIPRSLYTALSAGITFAIGYILIYQISRPLNLFRTLLLITTLAAVVAAYIVPFARELFFS